MANNVIGEMAIACAWPPGTPLSKYRYHGGQRMPAYTKALKKAYGSRSSWSAQCRAGASCDVFVGTCVRASGADKKFPRGLSDQHRYLRNSKKWKKLGSNRRSILQGGDVQIRSDHIMIVVEFKGKKRRANGHYKYNNGTFGCMDGSVGTDGRYKTYRCVTAAAGSGMTSTIKEKTTSIKGYKEYYYTKPKNFEDVKDVGYTSSLETDLVPTIRVETAKEDYDILKEKYPNINLKIDFDKAIDLSVNSLINYYKKYLIALGNILRQANFFEKGQKYVYFLNNDKLSYCQNVIYDNNISNDYEYFIPNQGTTDDWIDSYLDIYYKYSALLCYQDAVKNYTSVLGSTNFRNGIYEEIMKTYNESMAVLYLELSEYKNQNASILSSAEDINKIQKQITDKITDLNLLKYRLNIIEPSRKKNQKDLDKYKNYYDNLSNILNNFKKQNFSDDYIYWNKNIIQDPSQLDYWLEFLDNDSELSKYFITNIGLRTYVMENQNIESIYLKNIPQIIYYNENDDINMIKTGYKYLQMKDLDSLFYNSSQGISAKNQIDELLYEHSYASEEISVNIVPIYYLEPNTRILIYDKLSHINGEYIITKITQQLGYNQTMSFTASKTPQRLY